MPSEAPLSPPPSTAPTLSSEALPSPPSTAPEQAPTTSSEAIASPLSTAPAAPEQEPTSSEAPPSSPLNTASTAPSPEKERIERHLGALVGRLMNPGGWVAGARRSSGEPLGTGRPHPYHESTLRKQARELARRGAVEAAARAVEATVEQAVTASRAKATAYTDMLDQVYWTKEPSYAGPIGNRGNRLLACTYFGTTFVTPKNGPPLGYHLSWHKPASPLQDALEDLHASPARARWLTSSIRRHIWDRGGCGRPTLLWALAHRIPYLTVSKKSTHWTRFQGPPHVYARSKLPVFVRRDAKVARGMPKGSTAKDRRKRPTPQEVIFPAHPRKGRASTRALRYQTAGPLPKAELRKLDRVYKTRWPSNENPIKALVAVGFDRNLERGLTPTTSRGTDGRLARLEARETELQEKIAAFKPTNASAPLPKAIQKARSLLREKRACAQERAEIAAIPNDKGARMPTGAEMLCKNLMLLMYNVLAVLLWRSPLAEVRTMTPWRVQELLLCRCFMTWAVQQEPTLWVDPVPDRSERVLQEELVRVFNEASLSLRGRRLHLRLHDPPREKLLL